MSPPNNPIEEPFVFVSPKPEGYGIVIGPDNKEYLAPLHLIPDLRRAFESYRQKKSLGVEKVLPPITELGEGPAGFTLGEGHATYPPNPCLSKNELLSVHADILALQQLLGLSYKDAAHRLYMTEVEKAKVSHEVMAGLRNISESIDDALQEFKIGLHVEDRRG